MASQLDDYVILKRLAPALFGDVLLCDHRPSGDRVAVKRILKSAANEQRTLVSKKRVRENVAFERQLYQRLQTLGGHKHIMAMRDEIDFDGYLYMVFDYCARGELYEIVSSADNGKLSHAQARKYLTQIATGVQFLHANGYAHRDLSLENVLVTETDDCKVCDFGLAAPANKPTTETVGKMFYMAPEVLAGQRYEPTKADVWSLGVMLFIMLLGAPPVEAANLSDARFKIIATKGVRHLIQRWGLTDSLPAHAIDLLEGMLQAEPSQRMSMDDVVTHAFVTGTTSVPRRLMPTETVKMPAAPATPTATATAVKETKVGSTFQRLFRRSSKRRIMDVSSAQTTATSSAAVAA